MKRISVFDLDGTLTSSKWRFHLHEIGAFDEFDSLMIRDNPNSQICSIASRLYDAGIPVIISTGKRLSKKELCYDWMVKNNIRSNDLVMTRSDDDTRPTSEIKKENMGYIILKYSPDIIIAYDDRASCCKMYVSDFKNVIPHYVLNK